MPSLLDCYALESSSTLYFSSNPMPNKLDRSKSHFNLHIACAFLIESSVRPLYFSRIYEDKERHGDRSERAVTAGGAWSVPLSVTFGYLLPLYLASKSGWTNAAITGILPFPLYLSVLNTLLPRILRPLLDGTSVRLAILCSMGISLITAASAPQLHLGPIPIKEVFCPPPPPSHQQVSYAICTFSSCTTTYSRISALSSTLFPD